MSIFRTAARCGQATLLSFRNLLVGLALLMATSVHSQGISSVTMTPDPATTSSFVKLVMNGWYPNPCWSIAGTSGTWAGNTINIYIDFTPPSLNCPAAITNFTQTALLGTLQAGTYVAKIWNKDTNALLSTYNFSVGSEGTGSGCASPITLQCGTPYSGNNATNGSSNYTTYTIGGVTSTGLTGKEVIHRIILDQSTTVELTLKNLSQDLDLFLMSQCGNTLGLAKSENSGIQNETILLTLNAGTYTVIVDGYQGAVSNYLLSLNCSTPSSCGTPSGLQSNYITQYTAFLTWTGVYGAQNYTVEYRPTNGIWTPYSTTSNTYVTLGTDQINGSLASGAGYQWRVRANCSGGQTGYFATASFTTLPGSCTAPSANQLSVTLLSNTSAKVTCSATGPSYRFRYRKAGVDGGWSWQSSASSSNNRTYTALQPCTTYEVQCQLGCTGGGVSGFSSSQYFSTGGCTSYCYPPTVSQLFATNVTATSALLNCAAIGYNYGWAYRQLGASTWINLPNTTFNNTNITGLLPGTTYEFQVRVFCSSGNAWSSWMSTTFTTLSATSLSNNEPCGATTINPSSTCVYQSLSTIGATASTLPPAPIFDGCSTANMKDIWVKIPMPASGKILVTTTAGTQDDIVVTAYSGTGCTALTAFGCIDDNASNGDYMPDFTITSASQYIWLRIWGYNGATGTFNICVQTVNGFAANGTGEGLRDNETALVERSQEITGTATALKIYPVPARSILNVEMPSEENTLANISIYDQNGRQVLEQDNIESTDAGINETLDVSALPDGNYILRVSTEQSVQSALFIKIK
ncbi:MAG: T9SS type A sorting domain-containing protein [Bacteroidetes bacterium]|nr:T9SS type A sorting domain-containing protein [Bacteroidota bacterium]